MAYGKSRGAPYMLAHMNGDTGPDRPIIRVKAKSRPHEPSPRVVHKDGYSSFDHWKMTKDKIKRAKHAGYRLFEDPINPVVNPDEVD